MNQDKFASLPDFVRAALARKVAQTTIIEPVRKIEPVRVDEPATSTDYRSRVQCAIDESDELDCDTFDDSIIIKCDPDRFSVGTE